jgi:hypothetical protein
MLKQKQLKNQGGGAREEREEREKLRQGEERGVGGRAAFIPQNMA